jgi:hypothetical protein
VKLHPSFDDALLAILAKDPVSSTCCEPLADVEKAGSADTQVALVNR